MQQPGHNNRSYEGGLNPNTYYLVKVDGATYEQCISNSSGYVFFRYTEGYSDIDMVFEMEHVEEVPSLTPLGFLVTLVSLLELGTIVLRRKGI